MGPLAAHIQSPPTFNCKDRSASVVAPAAAAAASVGTHFADVLGLRRCHKLVLRNIIISIVNNNNSQRALSQPALPFPVVVVCLADKSRCEASCLHVAVSAILRDLASHSSPAICSYCIVTSLFFQALKSR
ncbi:unnamed protein product [Mesocestoides corti]|uniref:Uncharacterized protein n=1 Tax=Mesocestoides corti TaxID=53468 RepID=A0A0R3UB83_MESCO|nr:unnamed protein product [Mesocestoides corti]